MSPEYRFTFRKDQLVYVKVLSLLLCFLSILGFFFFQLRQGRLDVYQSCSILLVAIALAAEYRIRNNKSSRLFSISLAVTAICWVGMPVLNWLSTLFILMAILEYQARQPVEIIFGNEVMIAQGMIKRKHTWGEFANIVLLDGLLTLDFTSNRIIQKEIADPPARKETEDFNRYCRSKISSLPA